MKDEKDNKMDEIRKSLPKGVVESGIFTDNDLRVLHVLTRMQETDFSEFYKEHGYFHIANEKLREEAELSSNSTLDRSLDRLIGYGLISRTRGKRGKQSQYVYHADAANNFSMSKKNKKSKKKGPHSEKRTDTETQAVTVQTEKGPRSERNSPRLEVEEGGLFGGEKKGGNTGNEPNSLKMSISPRSDGENEPNSLRMRGGAHSEGNTPHSEKRTTDIDLDNIYNYHDDHVSRGQDPGEETSYGGEEKKEKIEKRNKEEEIAGLKREIAVCKAAMAEAKAAGDKVRFKEAFDERKKLGLQLAELEPEDKYAKMTDDEIVKMVMDQLKNGGNLFDLPTTVKNRWWQIHP